MASNSACAFLSESELLDKIQQIGVGYKHSKNSFFDNGNKFVKSFVKQGVVSFDDEEEYHTRNHVICNVSNCKKEFNTIFEFGSHYNALHRYLCNECRKCLPSSHFLDLHLAEQHDSFFAVLSERQPMYACFLEECKVKSKTPQERKDHCIKMHKFPANFRFETAHHHSFKKTNSNPDDMEVSTDSTNAKLQEKKTKTYTFGHQKQKVFNEKSYARILTRKQKDGKDVDEDKEMSALEDSKTVADLMNSLPS